MPNMKNLHITGIPYKYPSMRGIGSIALFWANAAAAVAAAAATDVHRDSLAWPGSR